MNRVWAAILAGASLLWAADIDESAFFQDSSAAPAGAIPGQGGSIKTDSGKGNADLAAAPVPAADAGPKVTFSGDLFAVGQASWRKGAFDSATSSGSQLVGDANVEARLSTGSRAMAIFEADQDAIGDSSEFHIREMFVDGNVGNGHLWIRAGKQVLQWGRGILWTPTDLVNVEGKTLVPRAGAREGATGVRLQVPIGEATNLYAFVNLADASAFDSISAAWRAETVVGPAEVALSGWNRMDAPTALGADGSTGFWGWDLQAGVLWQSGDIAPRPALDDSAHWILARDENRQQVRAGGGIGRDITVLGVPQRLRVDLEGFWQSDPIGSGILKQTAVHPWAGESVLERALAPNLNEFSFLAMSGAYTPNQLSSAYIAGMATLQQFIQQDLALSVQALENLQDKSGLSTVGLSWTTFHRFTAQLTGYWFWGAPHTEEVLAGRGPALEARMGVSF
jgi:hypothetical protein